MKTTLSTLNATGALAAEIALLGANQPLLLLNKSTASLYPRHYHSGQLWLRQQLILSRTIQLASTNSYCFGNERRPLWKMNGNSKTH